MIWNAIVSALLGLLSILYVICLEVSIELPFVSLEAPTIVVFLESEELPEAKEQ